jgi:hypothetical protein
MLPEGTLVFWIDARTSLLRRLEYPATRLAQEMLSAGCTDVSLTAELRAAEVDQPLDDVSWRVPVSPNAKPVRRFVVPPRPLPSPLLGRLPKDFYFTDLDGRRITRSELLGKVAVLVWFNNQPPSQMTLQRLEPAYETCREQADVTVHAVCVEPATTSSTQLRELVDGWGVKLPIVRDLEAFGRDVFQIPWAPTLTTLDSRGTVQTFEVGANPNLSEDLMNVLQRLTRGDDLAAEQKAQYERQKREYDEAVARETVSEEDLEDSAN